MSTNEWLLTGLIVLAYIIYDQMKDYRARAAVRSKKTLKRPSTPTKVWKEKARVKAPKAVGPELEPEVEPSAKEDLLSALKGLGFGKSDAQLHAQKAMVHSPDAALEELVVLALASAQNRLE